MKIVRDASSCCCSELAQRIRLLSIVRILGSFPAYAATRSRLETYFGDHADVVLWVHPTSVQLVYRRGR